MINKCPECGSTDDTYVDDGPYLDDFFEGEPRGVYMELVCDNCGCRWREELALTLYDSEILEHGDQYKEDCP